MLSALTVAVLITSFCLSVVLSRENSLALLFGIIGIFVLTPLAIGATALRVVLSTLSILVSVAGDWAGILSGFTSGAYGIPNWLWLIVAVILWFVVLFRFPDSVDDSDDGDSDELEELTDFRGIGPQLADRLRDAGFHTVDDISAASKSELAGVPGIASASAARIKSQVDDADMGNASRADRTTRSRTEGTDSTEVESVDETTDQRTTESLTSIPGIDATWVAALEKAGYDSVDDITEASESKLAGVVGSENAARIKDTVDDSNGDDHTERNDSTQPTETKSNSDESRANERDPSAPTTSENMLNSFDENASADRIDGRQSPMTLSEQRQTEQETADKQLVTLQQSANSHLKTAMNEPFDDLATTRYHLERAYDEYVSLGDRAERSGDDELLETAHKRRQTVNTRLDALSDIRNLLDTAREPVSTDGELRVREGASNPDLETAREAYETAIETADAAGFETVALEREFEAVVDELEGRESLIAAAEEVAAELDHVPTLDEVAARRTIDDAAYRETFGGWVSMLEASNIDLETAIIEDLRDLERRGDGVLDEVMYRQDGQYALAWIESVFESWSGAVESAFDDAHVTNDEDGNTVVRTEPTRNDYLEAIRRVADESNRVVKSTDVREQSPYSVNEIVSEFGSWRDALEAAGVDNELRLLQELHRVANEIGHRPTTTEMNQHGHVSAAMYADYFGSYTDAVDEAFGTEDGSDATTSDDETEERTSDNETEKRGSDDETNEETADDNGTADDDEILDDLVSEFDELTEMESSR